MLTSVNGFLTAMSDNVAPSSTPGQAQYIWAKGIATPSGTLGEGPPPALPAPTLPTPATGVVSCPSTRYFGALRDFATLREFLLPE